MDTPLSGKTALVTGATRGIGYAIAERLRKNGADVIATGTSPEGVVPDGCEFRKVDFCNPNEIDEFIESVSKAGIDILVNNAGINKISPFVEIPLDDFQHIQQINVTAPFLLCQAVIPAMKQKAWGRIINLSSVWGKIGKELRASYSTSKFGIVGMTAALAAEVAEFGILANCVSPGVIETEMTRKALSDEQLKNLMDLVPAKRLGKPEEIAAVVAWLVSPENSFICGQNIAVDGGLTRV